MWKSLTITCLIVIVAFSYFTENLIRSDQGHEPPGDSRVSTGYGAPRHCIQYDSIISAATEDRVPSSAGVTLTRPDQVMAYRHDSLRSRRQNRSDSQTPWRLIALGKRGCVERLGAARGFLPCVCPTEAAFHTVTPPVSASEQTARWSQVATPHGSRRPMAAAAPGSSYTATRLPSGSSTADPGPSRWVTLRT